MLTIEFLNDRSGEDTDANYEVRVKVNGTVIAMGRVTKHDRAQPWPVLVRRFLELYPVAEA